MSRERDALNIEKCIRSRLWYTSLVCHESCKEKYPGERSNADTVDFIESEDFIKSLIYPPNHDKDNWIIQVLLHKFIGDITPGIKHVQKQRTHLQMVHALQLCESVPPCAQQELLLLYDPNTVQTSITTCKKLHDDYIPFLKNNIHKNPALISWIINELFIYSNTSSNFVNALQDLCLSVIRELLESQLPEDRPSTDDNYRGPVFCILSKVNLHESKLNEYSTWLFPLLFRTCNVGDVELMLYSREDRKLFLEWSSFLDETYARLNRADSLTNAKKIHDVLFRLDSNGIPSINRTELLHRISKTKTHWLTDILDICYMFLMNGEYNVVSLILSSNLLRDLWPVLLFKLINDCPNERISFQYTQRDDRSIYSAVKFLAHKCAFGESSDVALRELNTVFKKYIKIMDCVLNWKGESFVAINSSETQEKNLQSDIAHQTISIKYVFFLLQHFHILSVLKAITNIHEQDYKKIQNLLKELGESENVFQSYLSTLSALKAILLCDSYNSNYKLIASNFSVMTEQLELLYPLSFRLQVTENIFSLLFLRHEHFDPKQSNSDEENISTEDEISQCQSKPLEQCLTGFICNKYAIRDLLIHLEEVICVTRMEYKSRNNVDPIEDGEIQKSIRSLTAGIMDAKWRLELYTNLKFIQNVGILEESCDTTIPSKSDVLTEEKQTVNNLKENSIFYQEESTSDESGLTRTKWRRRYRSPTVVIDILETKDIGHKPFFMNFMLASKESLVIQCLWKSDYTKAQEIIEMSEMKNTQLNGEVCFSRALHTFKQNMYKRAHTLNDQNVPEGNVESSMLENVRLAAQEGIQTSRHTSHLETFLASQEINLRMLTSDALKGKEILTLCVLDLALTMSQDSGISNKLCDVAMTYLKSCKTFDGTEYAHSFGKIYQLLYENKEEMSVKDILCDAKTPLSVKEYKERKEFWSDVAMKHHEFKESQGNKNTIIKILNDNNYLPGLKVLGRMITISSGTEKYLQNLFTYLQLLHTIIPSDHMILTVSELFKVPLHYYFGYQIFDLQVEPNKLEPIAQSLRVNLVYTILVNSCPRIYSEKYRECGIDVKYNGCIILNKNSMASSVMRTMQGPNQCVSEILTELLQVLHNLNTSQANLSYDPCRILAKHPDVQAVLNKTSNIASLDLSVLSVGDETLTFFLNTWNLMFLHSSLTIWSNNPPYNNLQHTISLMSIGYVIGDLGLVTLAELRSKLMNTSANKYFPEVEELNEPAWQDLDIMHDPRVIFAMANEFYGTPSIHVCNAKNLDNDLNNAFQEYLDHYSSLGKVQCSAVQKVHLPDLVREYKTSISQDSNSKTHNMTPNQNLTSAEDYLQCSEDAIEYIPASYAYNTRLNYSMTWNIQRPKKDNSYEALWKTRTIRPSLLQYLEGHCWVLSYLLQRIHYESPSILENYENSKRTTCLENLLTSSWIAEMKSLFEENQTLAAINETIPTEKLWLHFETLLADNKWDDCLKLLNALPDRILMASAELQCFKDKILSHVVSKKETASSEDVLQHLYQIKDIHILAQTVLCNINKWHINISENALLHTLHRKDNEKLPAHCKTRMNEILRRVLIFHKMLPYCETKSHGTWYDVAYCTEKIDPFEIMRSLISGDKFELCLEWLECQAFSLEIQSSITQDFLIGLLKNEGENFKQALKLLRVLPLHQSIKMCKGVLKKLESIEALQFAANYLLEHCKATETIKYRRTLVGIDILRMIESKERTLYIDLIKEPLLILEQLVMNCKFESIQKILSETCDKLEQVDISVRSFDKIIRFYAQRSLDCRVSLQRDSADKTRNKQQSFSEAESTEFVMPAVVPTKEEWIPNDKARECSCCKTVIFSMFNRRHHCRRCGRVICAVCSQHRMQVDGYPPSVLVRVCDDCKRQTVLQLRAGQGTSSTPSSEMFDYWRLTRDESHNQTIREEFSFEYAPNISLCLAILNLHSDHKAYTSFLLDRCDEMKCLLQPVSGGKVNPEVDHSVIIKMIRSLLVAAKVKCAKLGLNAGLVHCDRFLSQVDLIATLVQSDYLDLIPSDDLDEHTLRKLSDVLIEKEQWTLALDVSTKAGLDTQGVWATWGKACLKMGYFDQAREKFFHCLDKVQHDDFDDWVILSCPKEFPGNESCESTSETKRIYSTIKETKIEESVSRKSEFAKNRPFKNPPLLTEILQILDNLSLHKQHTLHSQPLKSNLTPDVLSTFATLKITNQGQASTKQASSASQNIYYQESLYYLLTYGSSLSILEFFLKYEEFDNCITFSLENDLEPDLFFNGIYLYCLKNGSTEKLHEAMRSKDTSLLIWKKYLIYVCHSLEKKQYLHILYELQLFMKDSIRAALTCIRFYTNEANDYTDLCRKGHFLLDAQKHLESELQIETLSRKRRKSTCSSHSGQGIFTMEMEPLEIDRNINTICRQMEIAKFLSNCEKEERAPVQFLSLFPDMDYDSLHNSELPTLFGNQQQKIQLAVLAIICGRDVGEGFGIAFRIMQDYNLPQQKVYSLAGHVLALKNNIPAIEQLIKCCHTSGTPNSYVISDYALTHCVKLLLNRLYSEPGSTLKNHIDTLVRLITDIELKINAYIECKQLKAAYLLAVKHSRAQDIRKILKESDRLGQNAIKAICIKWLQREPKK